MTETKQEWMGESAFVLFILPLMLSSVFQQLYAPINAAVVGRFNSTEAVAVIGACASIGTIQSFVITGMPMGFGAYLCACAAEEDCGRWEKGLTASLWLTALLALLGCVLAILSPIFLRLLNVPEELRGMAGPYAALLIASSGAAAMRHLMVWLLQALKMTGRTGLINCLSVVTQTALTVLMIGGFKLPVWSSALLS